MAPRDRKWSIAATIATTARDLPPAPVRHATLARDHEYKRHGAVSLLAGIDLLTGQVHVLVKDRHRSSEFIEFLKLLDAAYPSLTTIRLILDNHSPHKGLARGPAYRSLLIHFHPQARLVAQSGGRLFSKLARSVLRYIRVASKQELKDRIMARGRIGTSVRLFKYQKLLDEHGIEVSCEVKVFPLLVQRQSEAMA